MTNDKMIVPPSLNVILHSHLAQMSPALVERQAATIRKLRLFLLIAQYALTQTDEVPDPSEFSQPLLTSDALVRAAREGKLREWTILFNESLEDYYDVITDYGMRNYVLPERSIARLEVTIDRAVYGLVTMVTGATPV